MSADKPVPAGGDAALELRFSSAGIEGQEFTGERYLPHIGGGIRREHHHRYLMAADFCAGLRVLDVASGEGYGASLLARVARHVTGVDIDPAAIAMAKQRYPSDNLEFVASDASTLPFAEATFDVVTSFETIEHVEDWRGFLQEVARVLAPDGLLLISTPNREVYSEHDDYHNPFHIKEFGREEFRAALGQCFRHVALLEQRDIIASVLVEEGRPAGIGERLFYETQDGSLYSRFGALPHPRYFVALAANRPIERIGDSVLIDRSPTAMPAPVAALMGVERERMAQSLARAERQVDILRQSLRAHTAGPASLGNAISHQQQPSPQLHANLGERIKNRLRRLRTRLRRWLAEERTHREFDASFYLKTYPDIAAAGADAFKHYMDTGWREGRNPSPGFSTQHYLDRNPDVSALGINPLLHYVLYGRREGRSPHPGVESRRPPQLNSVSVVPTPLLDAPRPRQVRAELVAFYLPQFHAIPENDEWWGAGFTEWSNVRASRPQFMGHDQPRVPGELGYYNLGDKDVQRRQIELARLYGIGGFCFYFYWFSGRRLLERPVEAWLEDHSLDFPFCLCWANENWTRRWDGKDAEVLVAQEHSPEDDLAFIAAIAPYMRDPRYIRVDGKPILVVYRPNLLPSPRKTAQRWRTWCRENGIGEIHLAYTQSFDRVDPANFGFDAAIEFPPNSYPSANLTDFVRAKEGMDRLRVHDWLSVAERSRHYETPSYHLYRGVCPGWDNSPRRRNGGAVFVNNTPELYKEWLSNAIVDTESRIRRRSDRLVFINAWNEWAEGAYLEPDRRHGYAWLQATRDAVEVQQVAETRSVLIVSHDAHPHGAQYLAMHLAGAFAALQYKVHVLCLGDGPLLARFREVAEVVQFTRHTESQSLLATLRQIRATGVKAAFANTTVSGWIVPLLAEAGFTTTALVHEMPRVLEQRHLQAEASQIVAAADTVVFAAPLVRDGFAAFSGKQIPHATILPQGLLRTNPFRDKRDEAHRTVCERHKLPSETHIVLAVGFVEHRKGADLFLDIAERLRHRQKNVAFVWVGHFDAGEEARVKAEIRRRRLEQWVHFVGFVAEPLDYYAAASVYALTSREDPFPNVALEAAAVGTPIVAFAGATGAADFIVAQGGSLVPAFDCDAFAAAIEQQLSLPFRSALLPIPSIRQYAQDLMAFAIGQPRVSVIVPNYNYARYLRQRLSSIVNQTHPPYEIIVLDDGSNDDSLSVLNSLAAEWLEQDIRIVPNEANSGSVFRQWQKGLSLCSGDIVWIAEADDLAEPTFIEEMVARFDSAGVVLAYSQSQQIDDSGRTISRDYLDYTSDISDRWRMNYGRDGRLEVADAMAIKNTIPNVSAAVFRKSALQATFATLGERLFDYQVAGDWLVYMHVMMLGRVEFVARVLNRHRRHQRSTTSSTDASRHLREVKQMQETARELVHVDPQTQVKASAWLAHVEDHLGLSKGRARP